eukprot:3505329-Amphidinium_carterae.1
MSLGPSLSGHLRAGAETGSKKRDKVTLTKSTVGPLIRLKVHNPNIHLYHFKQEVLEGCSVLLMTRVSAKGCGLNFY